MKNIQVTIVAAVVALSFSSAVFAAGPETIELPASLGKVFSTTNNIRIC